MICIWSRLSPADATTTPPAFASLKIENVLTFMLPAYPGCPGKEAVKRVSWEEPQRPYCGLSHEMPEMCYLMADIGQT